MSAPAAVAVEAAGLHGPLMKPHRSQRLQGGFEAARAARAAKAALEAAQTAKVVAVGAVSAPAAKAARVQQGSQWLLRPLWLQRWPHRPQGPLGL